MNLRENIETIKNMMNIISEEKLHVTPQELIKNLTPELKELLFNTNSTNKKEEEVENFYD